MDDHNFVFEPLWFLVGDAPNDLGNPKKNTQPAGGFPPAHVPRLRPGLLPRPRQGFVAKSRPKTRILAGLDSRCLFLPTFSILESFWKLMYLFSRILFESTKGRSGRI